MYKINSKESLALSIVNSAYPYLLCSFVLTAVLGNLFALKIIVLCGLQTPAGMICFPFTFSICDIINDVYGRPAANIAIRTGVVGLIFYFSTLFLVSNITPSDVWHLQKEWDSIFSLSLRIFAGTIVGFYIGEKANSIILSILKYLFRQQTELKRYLTSTLAGVTLDTIIFNLVAFLYVFSFKELAYITLTQLILKYIFEIAGSFIASRISPIIKRRENLDEVENFPWLNFIRKKL